MITNDTTTVTKKGKKKKSQTYFNDPESFDLDFPVLSVS